MEMESLRGELERLFELDELIKLSSRLLGFNPREIGGTAGKASFVRALTSYCDARGAVEALCEAVLATKPSADPGLRAVRNFGLSERRELESGDQFDGFEILRKLGEGPQGAAYLATRDGGTYRIKLLHPETARDPRGMQRFLTFTRILAGEDTPSLPNDVAVGSAEDQTHYVSQAWFDGEPVSEWLERTGLLPSSEVQELLLRVAGALQGLHERGFCHGNLKLSNILVRRDGKGGIVAVQLLDAGYDLVGARRAPNGHLQVLSLASPATVAPERLRGHERAPTGDIYALGAIGYELVTGRAPFAGKTALDAAVSHLTSTPDPASATTPSGWVSPAFDALLQRLVSKDPEARPHDAASLARELEELIRPTEAPASEAELEKSIQALLADPRSEAAARALDSAAVGSLRSRAYGAFVEAAEQFSGEPSVQAPLLLRALNGYIALGERSSAEATYQKLNGLGEAAGIEPSALDETRRVLGKFEDLVESLLARIESAQTPEARASLMSRIGEIYARDLGDQTQAVIALSEALCEDPRNRAYVRRIEEIANAAPELWSEVLSTCSDAAADEEREAADRAPLLEQMGEWYTHKQGRPELALPCYQTALQLSPKSGRALDGVAAVYRANKMWTDLGDLLVHRAEVANSPSDARELRTQAAQVLEKHLQDLDGAQDLYERIIREDPGNLVVSEALGRIYEQTHELDRLVPLLNRQAEQERGPRRHAALCRLGDLQRTQLGDLDEARRCYDAVLAEAPTHPQALQGLDQTLAQAGKYKELLESLHRQLETSPTPRQEVQLWERIASVYEEEFLLHADAAVALESVLRLDPTRLSAMASLERLYRTLERWQELAELLERHSQLAPEREAAAQLLVQRARVLAEHVGDLPQAIRAYEQVTALAPERIDAFEAIADLHEALGNLPEAIQSVQEVAERVTDPAIKVRYYMRTARLLESRGSAQEALEWYGRVIALDPTHAKAAQALRNAYSERGDTTGLISLLERDLKEADGERAKSKIATEIALLELNRNKDLAAAERSARQALDWDPSNLRALTLVADLALRTRRYAEATELYQRALPRLEALSAAEAIRVRAAYLDAASQSPARVPQHMLEQAEILVALTPDDPNAIERAADLAFHHGSPEQTRAWYSDLLERFRGALTEDQLALAAYRLGEALRLMGDYDRALDSLEEARNLAPDSPHPLVAEVQIHEARKDYKRLALAKRQLVMLLEPEQRADALVELGELELDRLEDPKQARLDFEAAVALRSDDRRSLIRLMQIHTQTEDWAELVDVVGKLATFVDDPAQKAKYLLTAAMVNARQLGRREQAIGFYRQVLELDPGHAKALNEYVVLQVEQGDAASAERALRSRLEMARATSDTKTELEMLEALFALYQGLPNKLDAAIAAVERARELEPSSALHSSRLKDLYERDAPKYLAPAVAMHLRTLRQRPDDEDAYRRLRRLYTGARRADAAWCLCQVLHLLKLAEPEETRFFERAHSSEPAPAQASLDESDWLNYLTHPTVDERVTEIFALIEPVVVLARGQSLASLGYDPRMAVDLSQHPYPLGQMLFYSAGVMGMPLPPTFENHHEPGGLLYLNSNPPSVVMGLSALQPLPIQTAAFIAARQLANYRPGIALRHILSSLPVLKSWLFAAFRVCSPHFPVAPELEGPVLEAKTALERYLTLASRDRLVEIVSRLVQTSTAIDLKEWVMGVDFTADRVGLLLANDLRTVTDIIKTVEDPSAPPRDRRLQELILFAIDESFFAVRHRLGIALESSG